MRSTKDNQSIADMKKKYPKDFEKFEKATKAMLSYKPPEPLKKSERASIKKAGWISTSEQLPGWEDEIVLVFRAKHLQEPSKGVDMAMFIGNKWLIFPEDEETPYEDISHWRLLPDVPEEL